MIYMDNAATTRMAPEVLKAMEPYFGKIYGNPSSIHSWGREAKKAVEKSRGVIAKILNCLPEEIIFTSCATESNNLAIKGVALATQPRTQSPKPRAVRPHIITTVIEHYSVLRPCEYLEKAGLAEVTYLPVSKEGIVDPVDVRKTIRPNTILVSVMYANNEIGTIEPIAEIGKIIRDCNEQRAMSKKHEKGPRPKAQSPRPILFHTDAVQAFQYLDCNVKKLGVDLLSLTGHKFYGPKGVGVLYVKKGTKIIPQFHGGGHEMDLRSGTENVPYIVGIAEAAKIVAEKRKEESRRLTKLRDKLISGIFKNIPQVILSGSQENRLPNNVNFCFEGVEGESIVLKLDQKGVAASTGSACTSASLKPSHVLLALGIPAQIAQGSLRLTMDHDTKEKDINYLLKVLPKVVREFRQMSPLYQNESNTNSTTPIIHEYKIGSSTQKKYKSSLLYKEESYKLQGAFYNVRNKYGRVFKENVYEKALIEEFNKQKITFKLHPKIDIYSLETKKKIGSYTPDFLVFDKILVEVKAVAMMPRFYETQLYQYLKASEFEVGYLVNFGGKELDIRRCIYTNDRKPRVIKEKFV